MTPRSLIEPARLAGSALLHTQSDERLVDLTRAGNDRAFEAIVARYRGPLLRYCGRLLPSERAEDAVQHAFLNAYRAIGAGESELNLRPWLYRIAHNSALNLLRQNGWSYDQIPEDFDGVMQPPQAVEQSERIRAVVSEVKDLPARQRDALILRELEGRSYEEIAAALGVTGGSVRQLLNRARTTLRAAATAVTPPQLVMRLAERSPVDGSTGTRIAELTAGAGGVLTLGKVGTAIVVAGAVAGGVATGPLTTGDGSGMAGDTAEAAELAVSGAGRASDGPEDALAGGTEAGRSAVGRAVDLARDGRRGRGRGRGGDDDRRGRGRGRGGDDDNILAGDDDNSGPGSGDDDDDDRSGSGGGEDSSGSGSSGSGSGSSGSGSSGSGSGDGDDDSSGSGSGTSGGDSSGSGSSGSGSGSSGSGSSGSGSGWDSSGSGSSGSGSSGSGSGDDLPELDD